MTLSCSSTTLHDIIVNHLPDCKTITSVTSSNVVRHHKRLDGRWQKNKTALGNLT